MIAIGGNICKHCGMLEPHELEDCIASLKSERAGANEKIVDLLSAYECACRMEERGVSPDGTPLDPRYLRAITSPPPTTAPDVCEWEKPPAPRHDGSVVYISRCGKWKAVHEGQPTGDCFCGKPIRVVAEDAGEGNDTQTEK